MYATALKVTPFDSPLSSYLVRTGVLTSAINFAHTFDDQKCKFGTKWTRRHVKIVQTLNFNCVTIQLNSTWKLVEIDN